MAASVLTAVAAVSLAIGLVSPRSGAAPAALVAGLGALLLVGIGTLRRSRPSGG